MWRNKVKSVMKSISDFLWEWRGLINLSVILLLAMYIIQEQKSATVENVKQCMMAYETFYQKYYNTMWEVDPKDANITNLTIQTFKNFSNDYAFDGG